MRKFKEKIPDGSLRTTFIVGLPGEGPQDFDQLVDFVKSTRFEKMGAFVYSKEEQTPAHDMPNQVDDITKRERMNTLMELQKGISEEIQQSYIGRTLKVLIDEPQQGEECMYIGRSEYDAPDVDGVVYVHSASPLQPGDFVDVKILDAYEYDLTGDAICPT